MNNNLRPLLVGVLTLVALAPAPGLAGERAEARRPRRETVSGASILSQSEDPVGPPKPVFVVNTDATPVPVTGDLRGEVRVTNTPEVTVSDTVMVKDAPRMAFNSIRGLSMSNTERSTSSTVLTVPSDQQLVLTRASFAMAVGLGQKVTVWLELSDPVLGVVAIHDMAAVEGGPFAPFGGPAQFAGGPVDLIAEPGQTIRCQALRSDDTGNTSGRCSVSGYFVDLP